MRQTESDPPNNKECNNLGKYRIFYMKGTEDRILTSDQAPNFAAIIKQDQFADSFFIYNSDEVLLKLSQWQQTISWITPYYAVKSNPIVPLIQDLGKNGCHFDCASKGEVKHVIANGIPPQRIIYSNTVKCEKDLKWAAENGVQYTTADSFDELAKIQRFAPKINVLWRVRIQESQPEVYHTLFSSKFGDDMASLDDAREQFKAIIDFGTNLYGIHFHCGSTVSSQPDLEKAIKFARSCMKIGREIGHEMNLLDIGGGFPSDKISESVLSALSLTKNDQLNYRVIAEPGRHFSTSACLLAFRIIGKKIRQCKMCYTVNESLYHSFNCILMDGVSFEGKKDQFYQVTDEQGNVCQLGNQENCTLFGMTCDGRDVIANNIDMPSDIQVGDWIIMGGMGAYSYGSKSTFNGMKSTTKIYSWDGKLISKAKQIEKSLN